MNTGKADDGTVLGILRETIRDQAREWIEEGDLFDRLTEEQTRLLQKTAGDEPMTLAEMAEACRDLLAWDSPSFLGILGVDHRDVDHAVPTARGWMELERINGEALTFDFDFSRWDT